MIYRVIIQPNAEAELEAAYLYRYERAPQEAARWFAGFVEAINSRVSKNAVFELNLLSDFWTHQFRL